MNGPEHYREAEKLGKAACQPGLAHEWVMARLARAQVHATLALAAATAAPYFTFEADGRSETYVYPDAWGEVTR